MESIEFFITERFDQGGAAPDSDGQAACYSKGLVRKGLMTKSTIKYWNPLTEINSTKWNSVTGLEGLAEELTLSIDSESGEYTRLTRFHAGADTAIFGGKSHDYPEEIFIVSGRLYDAAFDMWL